MPTNRSSTQMDSATIPTSISPLSSDGHPGPPPRRVRITPEPAMQVLTTTRTCGRRGEAAGGNNECGWDSDDDEGGEHPVSLLGAAREVRCVRDDAEREQETSSTCAWKLQEIISTTGGFRTLWVSHSVPDSYGRSWYSSARGLLAGQLIPRVLHTLCRW
ncbi:hypothetical protein BD310DRAFT_918727 [Dichomitus squalens]|uniref:Uncharacterized protein n=1 Tax=Dichomitus squalens TaxID=114155 RepID=A0A4V2K954_9APHY|nr:hypothetical protein BD310DRAFT_918727 [Dichomitus squalens]